MKTQANKKCGACTHRKLPFDAEPCCSCWSKGQYFNWTPVVLPSSNRLARLDDAVGNPQVAEISQAKDGAPLEIWFTDGRKLVLTSSECQGADGGRYPAVQVVLEEGTGIVAVAETLWLS